jgi:diphthamide biosynthesis protein 3
MYLRAFSISGVAWSGANLCRVTKLEIAATLYSPETIAALTRYQVHLRKTRERLEEQRMRTVEELKALGDPEVSNAGMETNEEGFDDIKSRYGGLIKEVELLKVEIARLGA